MAKLEITLSRAHKIAERLKTKATELGAESERLAHSVVISGKAPGQAARLAEQGAKAIAAADAAEKRLRAVAAVRAAIAGENQKRGINAMLSNSDAVNKAIATRKSILETAKDGNVTVFEFADYTPLAEDAYGSGSVRVNMFTDAQREKLAGELAALQREAFGLADQVAEANAARFTIELDDDIAAEVTGA
jgi:hypothetical protein